MTLIVWCCFIALACIFVLIFLGRSDVTTRGSAASAKEEVEAMVDSKRARSKTRIDSLSDQETLKEFEENFGAKK